MTIVMLNKERKSYEWSYIIDRQFVRVMSPHGSLLEQMVYVITAMRDTYDLYDKDVTICSPTLLRAVVFDLAAIFPAIHFVPINDASITRVFRKVMNRADDKVLKPRNVTRTDVLYICSDASKSGDVNSLMCGWAWFSTAEGKDGYNFGVTEHNSTVTAELEGILHAIVDNATSSQKTLHIYCDSQSSVAWAQAVVLGRTTPAKIGIVRERMVNLIAEARKVAAVKKIKIEWVRGHQTHRLNMAADYLSREARVAANNRGRLLKNSPRVEAVLTFIDK